MVCNVPVGVGISMCNSRRTVIEGKQKNPALISALTLRGLVSLDPRDIKMFRIIGLN